MTEKWGQIQGKWKLSRVSGGLRVIRVRVTGILLYCFVVVYLTKGQIQKFVHCVFRKNYHAKWFMQVQSKLPDLIRCSFIAT